jgi:hypothetical protein
MLCSCQKIPDVSNVIDYRRSKRKPPNAQGKRVSKPRFSLLGKFATLSCRRQRSTKRKSRKTRPTNNASLVGRLSGRYSLQRQ